jgi:hypothetical protein
MKYFFLAYLFSPSGEFLLKDIAEVDSMEICETMTGAYSKSLINSGNQASFFCLTKDQYYLNSQEEYEGKLNPVDGSAE